MKVSYQVGKSAFVPKFQRANQAGISSFYLQNISRHKPIERFLL